MKNEVLDRLQRWYEAQCDGEWEHDFGVRIETLDNPGWLVAIDLAGTALEGRALERVEEGMGDDNLDDEERRIGPWLVCYLEDGRFKAACGARDLERALAVFLAWAEG